MKRAGHLFERIIDRENLRMAVGKALKGKRSKADARAFVSRLDDNLTWMAQTLPRGEFPLGAFHQFTVFDPKQRLITAPCFRERVLHHAIMNVCEPIFERWLIADTFACRRGKGRAAALNRALQFSWGHGFFLKLDVRKYFDSVVHGRLKTLLERLFKDRMLLHLFGRIIDCHETTPGRGLPIGSLTSQHFANFYLGWFDRFVKERLRVRSYVRYMDDCVLWADSTRELHDHLEACRDFLSLQLGLEFKPWPFVNRVEHGIDFLGCRLLRGLLVLNRRSRVRFRRKLAALEAAHTLGEIDELDLQQRATALVAFARSAGIRSWTFRRRVLEQILVSGLRPRTG